MKRKELKLRKKIIRKESQLVAAQAELEELHRVKYHLILSPHNIIAELTGQVHKLTETVALLKVQLEEVQSPLSLFNRNKPLKLEKELAIH